MNNFDLGSFSYTYHLWQRRFPCRGGGEDQASQIGRSRRGLPSKSGHVLVDEMKDSEKDTQNAWKMLTQKIAMEVHFFGISQKTFGGERMMVAL